MNAARVTKLMAIAGCAVMCAAIAGCAGQAPPADLPAGETTAASPPAPTPDESATPSVSAPADPEPSPPTGEPAEWVIDETAIGPVALGADFGATLDGLSDEWVNDAACPEMAYWTSNDGAYLVSFHHDGQADTATISEITVEALGPGDAGPRTAEGLGLGSTGDDVTAAYPGAVSLDAPIGGGSYLRTAETGSLFFGFAEGEGAASTVTVTSADLPSYESCA
ncbi:hypothetical protein GCM10010910_08440 [Microbacterium nanhaiense]|uniref:Uncharacterized protein n=1 Tax=Microbacterium nanhaiense TaxID=1301026 RepID=A0ABQ2MXT0_9MICO|nr:hypothetical protein [Microbacterium nanhaiense]GGO61200.1 hypothetical protein GCM10010910_08440 [Microbacterium nanhaiense]